jgi:hypothetical protein
MINPSDHWLSGAGGGGLSAERWYRAGEPAGKGTVWSAGIELPGSGNLAFCKERSMLLLARWGSGCDLCSFQVAHDASGRQPATGRLDACPTEICIGKRRMQIPMYQSTSKEDGCHSSISSVLVQLACPRRPPRSDIALHHARSLASTDARQATVDKMSQQRLLPLENAPVLGRDNERATKTNRC